MFIEGRNYSHRYLGNENKNCVFLSIALILKNCSVIVYSLNCILFLQCTSLRNYVCVVSMKWLLIYNVGGNQLMRQCISQCQLLKGIPLRCDRKPIPPFNTSLSIQFKILKWTNSQRIWDLVYMMCFVWVGDDAWDFSCCPTIDMTELCRRTSISTFL